LEATGWAQVSLAFLDAAVQLLHVGGAVCRCTILLEHTVVTRHSAYRWQQYDVIMTSQSSIKEVSKRYQQNFLLCKNNEITACDNERMAGNKLMRMISPDSYDAQVTTSTICAVNQQIRSEMSIR